MRSWRPCSGVGSHSPSRNPPRARETRTQEPPKTLPPSTYPCWRAGAGPREMGNQTNWPGSSVFSSRTCRYGWMSCGRRSRGERPRRWRRRPTCSKAAPVTWEQFKWRRSAPGSRVSAPPANCRAHPSCLTISKRNSNASAPPWKPPSRRSELVDDVSTGVKSLSTLTVALALFGLAGSAVMVAVPGLFAGPVRPEFTVFLVAGVAAIVSTAGFFGYIYRLGMGFGRTVLVLAYKAFDEVEKRAVPLGDATLLASFFWLGLALILLYHVMWIVFFLTLVSIWPFRTYTPK